MSRAKKIEAFLDWVCRSADGDRLNPGRAKVSYHDAWDVFANGGARSVAGAGEIAPLADFPYTLELFAEAAKPRGYRVRESGVGFELW